MVKKDAGPEYLKAEDLIKDGVWTEFILKIKEVHEPGTHKAADGTVIDDYVIEFEKATKKLIMSSAVNKRIFKFATGTALAHKESCVGKSIILQAREGDWFGEKNVSTIRITIPEGTTRPMLRKKDMGRKLTGQTVGALSK